MGEHPPRPSHQGHVGSFRMTRGQEVPFMEPGSFCGEVWAWSPNGIGPDGRGPNDGQTHYRLCMAPPGDHREHGYWMYRDVRPCEVLLHGHMGRQARCQAYSVEFFVEYLAASAQRTADYWKDCAKSDGLRETRARGTLLGWGLEPAPEVSS